jgi:dihydropteroate synthase
MTVPEVKNLNTGQAATETGGWKTARFLLPVRSGAPLLMGVLNVTPDSFSDGGRYHTVGSALEQARRLLDEGADILDVGAESTRPGAQAVSADEEWRRLEPILRELRQWQVPISLDTMKSDVMARGIAVGVDILNDVSGFQDEQACAVLRGSDAGGVIMHMQGQPRTMQTAPVYVDVQSEVREFLQQRLTHLQSLGVASDRLLIDPGFGFGKTLDHNLTLFRGIAQFATMGAGVLVGVSRKSMIGQLLGRPDPAQRVYGSVAAAVKAAASGAQVLRVHDVQATRDALKIWQALSD